MSEDGRIEVTPEMLDAGHDCFMDLRELLGPSREELLDTIKRAFIRMRMLEMENATDELEALKAALKRIAHGPTSGPPGLNEGAHETAVRELTACRDIARKALGL